MSKRQRVSDSEQGNLGITQVRVDELDANPWNPNRMSEVAFREYVEEVQHLQAIPKPIVCRPVGDRFQIIDGEHAWRAAQEVGLIKVPCEVLADADDFECMRQTFKRNRGGTDNPVRLGQMFERMMKEKKLSARALAEEMGISDTTIRNNLAYAKAARMRTGFAGEDREAEIAKLSKRQMQMYTGLPEELRDKWLDAGADLAHLEDVCKQFDLDDIGEFGAWITDAGLADLVKSDYFGFRTSLAYLLGLTQWSRAHRNLKRVNEYVRPLAELQLPVGLMYELPCTTATDNVTALLSPTGNVAALLSPKGSITNFVSPKDNLTALLPPKDWRKILTDATTRTSNPKGQLAVVQSAVRVALRKAGIDLETACGPEAAETAQLVQKAPAFIRAADRLTLEEQATLAFIKADAPEQMVTRAKEMAVKCLQQRRGASTAAKAKKNGQPAPDYGNNVEDVFQECLNEIYRDERRAKEEQIFADPEKLLKTVLAKLAMSEVVAKAKVNGTPAADVLIERLNDLDWPEFYLLATFVLRSNAVDDAVGHWLASMKATETPRPRKPR